MATTSPDNIYFPSATDQIAPLETVFATQASSVQTALSRRQRYDYVWANATARNNQTGMLTGATGIQADTLIEYVYMKDEWTPSPLLLSFTSTRSVNASSETDMTPWAFSGSLSNTASSKWHTVSTNLVTLNTPGVYSLSSRLSNINNSSTQLNGRNFVSLKVNGATLTRTHFSFEDSAIVSIPDIYLGAGTTIGSSVYQSTGGATSITATLNIARR